MNNAAYEVARLDLILALAKDAAGSSLDAHGHVVEPTVAWDFILQFASEEENADGPVYDAAALDLLPAAPPQLFRMVYREYAAALVAQAYREKREARALAFAAEQAIADSDAAAAACLCAAPDAVCALAAIRSA